MGWTETGIREWPKKEIRLWGNLGDAVREEIDRVGFSVRNPYKPDAGKMARPFH